MGEPDSDKNFAVSPASIILTVSLLGTVVIFMYGSESEVDSAWGFWLRTGLYIFGLIALFYIADIVMSRSKRKKMNTICQKNKAI